MKAENDDDGETVDLVKVDGKWKVHAPVSSGSGRRIIPLEAISKSDDFDEVLYICVI